MIDSLWTGGPAAYEKGLTQEYLQNLRKLQSRLASCAQSAEKLQIDAEIARLHADYKRRLADISTSLF